MTWGACFYSNRLIPWFCVLIPRLVRDHVLAEDVARHGSSNIIHLIEGIWEVSYSACRSSQIPHCVFTSPFQSFSH